MANQTQILNVSDEMKLNDNVQMKNVKEQEENMYSSSSDTTEELCSSSTTDARGNCVLIITEIGGFIGVVQSICHPFATAIFKIITEQRKGSEHAEQSADSLPIFYL